MTDDLDLSAVAADAALLDALAVGAASDLDDLAGLGALRAALDEDLSDLLAATPGPVSTPAGSAPVVLGLHRPTARTRRSRQAAALLAGAALALSSTGVAAATYEARPGDAFYGLRTAVAGPRAEDPALLRERLDAVQERLEQAPGADSAAAEELAEVAALLATLDPALRSDLSQRLAALTEQLATSRAGAAGEVTGTPPPAGPPQTVPTGPPADGPADGRPEQVRPEPTRGPGATSPSRPAAPSSAQPEPPRATPEPDRPSPRENAPKSDKPAEQPAPRGTQGARPSEEPAQEPAQEPAPPADEARAPGAGSAVEVPPVATPR
jgi:hypothetical protein